MAVSPARHNIQRETAIIVLSKRKLQRAIYSYKRKIYSLPKQELLAKKNNTFSQKYKQVILNQPSDRLFERGRVSSLFHDTYFTPPTKQIFTVLLCHFCINIILFLK